MMISGLQGSILENTVMEDAFQVESISTAKLFGLANEEGVPIVAIDKSNIASVLPTLPFDVNIKEDITNAVNQGSQVRIPQSEITYEDWTGIGFLTENPATGEAGWMLSGMVAGGMTVWNPERWDEEIRSRLEYPYSEPPNTDPLSAVSIEKVSTTDRQWGTVGMPLDNTLEVLVRDKNGKNVEGADVTFTIKAGGGELETVEQLNDKPVGHGTTLVVKTDYEGHARGRLILGKLTGPGCKENCPGECQGLPEGNPTMVMKEGDTYSQQIGENIVDAALTASGTGLTRPFVAYAEPDYEKAKIRKTHGDGIRDTILSFAGFISAVIDDQYCNPISNRSMKFTVGDAIDQSNCENTNKDTTKAVLVRAGDPCLKTSPTHNQCATESNSITETTSSAGALVEVILGGMPDGKYPITVASEGLMSDTFHLYTNSFGNCDGESFPDHRLILRHVYAADQYGHNIDAGAVGSSIPIMARTYHLREGEIEIRNKPTACDGDTVYCDVLVGDRNYSINTDFVEPTTLSFTGPTGTPLVTNLGNGVYTANYTLAKGENQININSRATIELQLSYPILSCKDCGKSDDDIIHNGEIVIDTNTTMKVYGVDITIPPKLLVLVDGKAIPWVIPL